MSWDGHWLMRSNLQVVLLSLFAPLPARMTVDHHHLRVELWDEDGVYGQANYDYVNLNSGTDNRRLYIGNYTGAGGNVADALDSFSGAFQAGGVDFTKTGTDNAANCRFSDIAGWYALPKRQEQKAQISR